MRTKHATMCFTNFEQLKYLHIKDIHQTYTFLDSFFSSTIFHTIKNKQVSRLSSLENLLLDKCIVTDYIQQFACAFTLKYLYNRLQYV